MTETTRLNLPYLAPAQAQKHVTVNESLSRLDAAVQLSVRSRVETTPPALAQDGDGYLVAAGGVNAWEGRDGQIASFVNGGWIFLTPRVGWRVWIAEESVEIAFDGTDWIENVLAVSPFGAALRAEVVEADVTLSGGVATEETGYLIPQGSIVFGITGRVITEITGSLSDWSLGVDGALDRYGSGIGLSAGAWLRGLTGQPVTYFNPTKLVLTANGGDFAGGEVRLSVHCLQFDLPRA